MSRTLIVRWRRSTQVVAAIAGFWAGQALGQMSDGSVRIGVLTDLTGQFADVSGQGSVVAAQLAAEDFGGSVRGVPISILSADHLNKPDVGATIVRRWFDEGVDAITDIPVSSIALAAQEIAREKHRTLLIAGAASSDLTGKACSPYATHWADDTYALAGGTARAVTASGGKSWFFLAADYAFGQAMERDASQAVVEAGGRVLGSVRHPLGAQDFSSFVLQADSSKAEVIGLANVGSDTVNAVRAAEEFGLTHSHKLAAFLIFLTDIRALGLEAAQGLMISDGFYWDRNDATRKFAQRFMAKVGRMPTKEQASVYASVAHYLKAVQDSGTDAAARVNAQMRAMPVDYFGQVGSIRPDGRVLYDLTLYRVKAPAESKGEWDLYEPVSVVPRGVAFRAIEAGGCTLTSK